MQNIALTCGHVSSPGASMRLAAVSSSRATVRHTPRSMKMTEEYRQTLAVACPVHPENARIRRVSVVYEEMSHRLLSPVPVLRAATRLAWAGTACGVLGMAAIWIGNLIGGGGGPPALITGMVCVAYALA